MATAIFTDEQEKYIRHEVAIQVLKETQSARFLAVDATFVAIKEELERLDTKINWVLGVTVGGIFLSIFLKIIGVF